MSLLSDPDFLIHQLRLSYLRHVDDPYGPRILSLNPAYSANPHIIASGLADPEAWPELGLPATPTLQNGELVDATGDKKRNVGGGDLKYSQTIVGQNRIGGMGMRVNARRVSSIKDSDPPMTSREDVGRPNGKRVRSDSEPTPAAASPAQNIETRADKPIPHTLLKRSSADMTALEQALTPVRDLKPPQVELFKPSSSRATEMTARHRLRLHSHTPSTESQPQSRPIVMLQNEPYNPEMSDHDNDVLSDDDEEVSDLDGNDLPLDGGFSDPENSYGPHIVLDGSVSDGILSTSNSGGLLTSPSSGVGTYDHLHPNARRAQARLRLDSLNDKHPSQSDSAIVTDRNVKSDVNLRPGRTIKSKGSYFELVVPPYQNRSAQPLEKQNAEAIPAEKLLLSHAADRPKPQQSKLTFTRVKVPPVPTTKIPSALSLMLASHGSKPENPFSELYSLISSRSNPLTLQVVYPFSEHRDPVTLRVRSDATVEEVIGFGLWTYWEEGFIPKLDDCDETKKPDRLSAAGWSLRVTEDGEVDDDFPAFDRMAKMSKFNFEGYAILSETPAQTEKNRITESKIVRRSSRVMLAKKKDVVSQALAPPTSNLHPGSLASPAPMSSSIGGGSSISQGPQQLLKVRIAEKADVQTTIPVYKTIPVKESMYMEEVLENVCRRWFIDDPKQWCLVYDMKILVPLDRTVASLQGKTELYLVKIENLSQYDIEKQHTRSTDPNASIFSGVSDISEKENNSALDFTKAYKKYTVYRKMPMLVVRYERILAIDGEYVHIMPVATRAFLDSMKTSSYHIKSIANCTQSAKSSANFKLVVVRDGGTKRYDFEAESPRIAAEIVRTIRDLRSKRLERTSTLGRSRRSRPPR